MKSCLSIEHRYDEMTIETSFCSHVTNKRDTRDEIKTFEGENENILNDAKGKV